MTISKMLRMMKAYGMDVDQGIDMFTEYERGIFYSFQSRIRMQDMYNSQWDKLERFLLEMAEVY